MSVTGVGSSFSYIYNAKTGKLSTKDGSYDEFVAYFNGDLSEEESTELNGYDTKKKYDINRMIEMFSAQRGLVAVGAKDVFNPKNAHNGYEYEISGEITDSTSEVYAVNGEKVFQAMQALDNYTTEEVKSFLNFGTNEQPFSFKTYDSKGYDAATNSIHIAIGDIIDLKNGCTLQVKEDRVVWTGSDLKVQVLAGALATLIHFADQQCMSAMIDKECTPMLLELLRDMGLDTGREFTINETKCHVVDGRIKEVGNVSGIPNSVYNAAAKRYEEWLNMPLAEKNKKG